MAKDDLIGRIYGDYYLYDFNYEKAKEYKYYYKARCIKCGAEKEIEASCLKAGKCLKCKCNPTFKKPKIQPKGYENDLTGQKFGHLKVISFAYQRDTHSQWNCECDLCGKSCVKDIGYLRRNKNPMCTNCSQFYSYDNKYDTDNIIEYKNDYVIVNGKVLFDLDDLELIQSYHRHICINTGGYAYFTYHGKECFLHRLLMGLPIAYDNKTKIIVDHINGNRLDNRRSNLRICKKEMNPINCKTYKNNTSGCKGVTWMKRLNKWQVMLYCNKQRHYLGVYSDYDEAVRVRKEAEEKYFGEFKRDE
jgi:hypothetical protein